MGLIDKLFKKKEKVITQEEMILKKQRELAAYLTMLKISERMKARPVRMKAQARQRWRAAKRAKMLVVHKRLGIVRDEDYGEKPKQMKLSEFKLKGGL